MKTFLRRSLWWGSAGLGIAATLMACGGGGGGAGSTGTLRVALTDAPACGYDHVWVTVEKVRVHASPNAADEDAGWSELVLATPQRIDLLTLSNGVLAELGQTALPAGNYTQVRLVLADNSSAQPLANAVQPTGSAAVPLTTPSAQQSGLKMQAGFEVAAGQMADLVLDFDACRSVVKRGNSGNYNLRPVVSVFPRLVTGIEGHVGTSLPAGSTQVSAQVGGQPVRATAPDAQGRFSLPYLPEGTYDLVVTAEGFSTAVVTGVTVSAATGNTVINGPGNAITPPASAMKEVSGTVSGSSPVLDPAVRAVQVLSGGPTVELAFRPVDVVTGAYSVRLATAAPLKASYSGTALGSFTPDTAVAGEVRLQAVAPNRTRVEITLDLDTVNTPVDFNFAP